MMTPYGTMIAVEEPGQRLRFVIGAYATPNARTAPTIAMFRELLVQSADRESRTIRPASRAVLVIQYDDQINHDVGSVAYCRRRGEAPAVHLVPDTFFFHSEGYRGLREAAAELLARDWENRRDMLFWRGSATHNGIAADGARIEHIEQVPRVALCRKLRHCRGADTGIMAPWGFEFPPDEAIAYLKSENILRPPITMLRHAEYRYLIDIDGVASAWSFFEKLLLGACVLKVGSPFEQWFYKELREWQHYVPVRADLSDLLARLDWCREHPRQAREIAAKGQSFALECSFETARHVALDAIRRALLVMD